MTKVVDNWLNAKNDEAQQLKRCLAPESRIERDRLRAACRKGAVLEVYPGIYASATYWNTLKKPDQELHKMRTLQQLHPDWVFAGPTAALAHGLATSNAQLSTLWVACSKSRHLSPTPHKRYIVVTGDTPAEVNGLRCTSFMRTVGDCMRLNRFRNSLAIADSALRIASISQSALAEGIREACPRLRDTDRIRATIMLANSLAESGGESIARAVMLELGIAPPILQRQYSIPSATGEPCRTDFSWQVGNGWLVGELDGHEKYTSAEMRNGRPVTQVVDEEHRRESYISALPEVTNMVRFSYADVMHEDTFLTLLVQCGVPRTFACDDRVVAAGGTLLCR